MNKIIIRPISNKTGARSGLRHQLTTEQYNKLINFLNRNIPMNWQICPQTFIEKEFEYNECDKKN